MTLADVRDWLSTLSVAEHYYVGRLDTKQDKSLGVYPRSSGGEPVEAIGQDSSYDIKPVTLLLHWNKNAAETEEAAYALWEHLRRQSHLVIGSTPVQFIKLQVPAPVSVMYDDKGVYEYVIDFDLIYKR